MEALVNVDSSLICARIIQVFVGAFLYFMIAKAVGSENKAKWFKRRMKYTFSIKEVFLANILTLAILLHGRV